MRLHDVTWPITHQMAVWPGDPAVSVTRVNSIAAGDPSTVSQIRMGAHTGTHIDAPAHFFENGATMDALPLETFIGPCLVIELACDTLVEKRNLLDHDLSGCPRILFKTRNSTRRTHAFGGFDTDYVALAVDAAQHLIEMGVVLVGIDALSIEPFTSVENPVHRLLLGNRVIILEGLDLSGIAAGAYELFCMPLCLYGCEAAPARVVLRECT